MYKIVSKKLVVPKEFDVWVEAPRVARHVQPGQFVIIRTNPKGERIPLTVADFDREKGLIRMIFQIVGKTTAEFAELNEGDSLSDILGPLGTPSEIKHYGTVLGIGGGVGIAALFPIIRALKEAGNKVITILGGRNKDLVIMKEECEQVSDELIITTDDGSAGMKGVVTDAMALLSERGEKIDQAWAVGPSIMMKFASFKAKELNIPIFVSLNPIMIDGTGMCGGCRVTINDQIRFACVDGPEFDGWGVNWNEFMNRLRQYKDEEKMSLEKFQAEMGE
ncbi:MULTISPECIES: sulfide/dihydroorotate dehydrogenase-like FAD/NAD-binding protein [Aminobacterium]|uniref:sulfide/dihydroorotate dehydrogenase-like FAD/NAD-binding protein n=1 Tax=Aminobacterium TaxID=81466 RepID=UPI000466E4AA|nr:MULTISPECIES: sulfide/dihydroorotate dehydrogenase-like FAD/NAD-binding protein [Aminobacterium]